MTRLAVVAAVVVALAAGCGGSKNAETPGPAPATTEQAQPSGLTDLRDIGQLQSLFNTRSGEPRLIVLVSPT